MTLCHIEQCWNGSESRVVSNEDSSCVLNGRTEPKGFAVVAVVGLTEALKRTLMEDFFDAVDRAFTKENG